MTGSKVFIDFGVSSSMVKRNKLSDSEPVRYADLFAGIGGFAAVFESFGLAPSYSVEKDTKASSVYFENWDHNPLGNIVEDDSNGRFSKIKDFEILSAGFPCQPFSKSGSQHGKHDPDRGNLFNQIENILTEKKPRVIFLENVRNLAGPRHREYWDEIISRLRSLGYRVDSEPEVLSPHRLSLRQGGRPQHRERVFILGTYIGDLKHDEFEKIQKTRLTEIDPDLQSHCNDEWEQLIINLPLMKSTTKRTPLSEQDEIVIEAWDLFLKQFRTKNPGTLFPSFPIWSQTWNGDLNSKQDMPAWKIELVKKNEIFYENNKSWIDKWVKDVGFNSRECFTASNRKFEWQAGENKSLFDGLIQFRPSGVRAKRLSRFPALVAITQLPVIGPDRTYLSVADAKYLQGLPDNFSFDTGQSEAASFKQLGNGINSGLAWRALRAHLLRDQIWLEKSSTGRKLLEQFSTAVEDLTPLIQKRLR